MRQPLSANERIAEFLDFAIQDKFAYVNKLERPQAAFYAFEIRKSAQRISFSVSAQSISRGNALSVRSASGENEPSRSSR